MSTWSHCLLQAQAVAVCSCYSFVTGCMQGSHSCTFPTSARELEENRKAAERLQLEMEGASRFSLSQPGCSVFTAPLKSLMSALSQLEQNRSDLHILYRVQQREYCSSTVYSMLCLFALHRLHVHIILYSVDF